ncbi:MAG: D-alanyl-D-alanine carboxypeptidase [Mycolicibacterium cosmeticum]|nr:D-alanyl-D-alanine carboxypeptidase [Mycolicibacterium cosmeticum]
MGRLLTVLLSCLSVMFALTAPSASADVAIPAGAVPAPEGPAEAWVVADIDSGEVLAARNEYGRYAPASTIKVLLALTVLDELPLDATVVANVPDTVVECNCAGVAPGQTYTTRQLLEGLLLVSGNDAANTLATMLGGRDTAIAKMTAKAASVGATATTAGSPSGLDGPGIDVWTTPHDLAVIFRAALAHPVFAEITAQPTALFPSKTGERVLVNQDEMLARYPGMLGGKTGFTDLARKTFVGAAQRDGRRLVVVLMHGLIKEGGPTYWDQVSALLDWGFAQGRGASVGAL